jgi:hypothetical protein
MDDIIRSLGGLMLFMVAVACLFYVADVLEKAYPHDRHFPSIVAKPPADDSGWHVSTSDGTIDVPYAVYNRYRVGDRIAITRDKCTDSLDRLFGCDDKPKFDPR